MRAILHDFKGYSFASELVADVSSADIFCQNIYGEICFTLRTPLFLLNKFSPEPPSPDHDILPSAFISVSTENAALLYMATCCSEPISCFCYSVTNFLHHTFSKHFLRVWIYLCPSNIELKDRQDISQMACNTAQKQYLTLCLGAEAIGNSDESASLISLQHALTAWQIWKGQIWNSKVFQPCNR